MIKSIRHKGLRRFYETGDIRGIDARRAAWLRILLTALDAARVPADMQIPGARLHALQGARKGEWAVAVTGNWRMVFRFDDEAVCDVDLVDYH